MPEKNPFANSDGSPIDGEEEEFIEWEKFKAKKILDEMPADERIKAIESEKAISKRMNS